MNFGRDEGSVGEICSGESHGKAQSPIRRKGESHHRVNIADFQSEAPFYVNISNDGIECAWFLPAASVQRINVQMGQ